ncbi:transposase [Myxococcus stipitatus]|uniref:transposase n=1 Tax=Myxococcus stipitatus TaxID=83455 RepID=UPI0031454035
MGGGKEQSQHALHPAPLESGEYLSRIHLVLDNAAVHSSRKTRKALAQFGGRFVLHFPPPYCPQGNRIERVWLGLHANVTRNHRCRTMDRLMARVHAYLAARSAQRAASPALRRADLRRTA